MMMALAGCLLFMVYSCAVGRMNRSLTDEQKQLITDAKQMFSQFSTRGGGINVPMPSNTGYISAAPIWKQASTHEDENFQVVEIPLMSEIPFGSALPEAMNKFKETGDERYRQSKTCIVYKIDKTEKTEDMFFMTIMPALAYLELTKLKPFDKMSFIDLGKSFSGLIIYQNMKGETVNRLNYVDGEIASPIREHMNDESVN